MKTFQNVSKQDFVNMMKWHQEQDLFEQGSYGEDQNKGCFMGCSVKSIAKINGDELSHDNHKEQADYLGLPEWLWHLCELIFEGLDSDDASKFAIDITEALPECDTKGVDKLEGLVKIFIIESTNKYHDNKKVHDAVEQVKIAIESGDDDLSSSRWAAASAAESAARSAASAARSAAWAAAWAAESAARSAASAAASAAAWAAESAVRAAAWAAAWAAESAVRAAAWDAESAESAVMVESYKDLSVYLIQLLKGL